MQNILIPDAGNGFSPLVALAIKRQFKNTRIIACFHDEGHIAINSRFFDEMVFVTPNLNIVEIINLIKKYSADVLYPVSEVGIEFCIFNFYSLRNLCKVPVLPTLDSFTKSNDKYELYNFLKSIGVKVPYTELLRNFHDVDKDYIIKPRVGSGGSQIHIVDNNTTLEKFNKKYNNHIIQEYINGFDIDCSMFSIKGKIINYTIQKPLHRNNTFSPLCGVLSFIKDEEIISVVSIVIRELNWSGVAHIDLRYSYENEVYLIEINPRYWNSTSASLSAGVNFPALQYKSCYTTELPLETEFEEINFVYLKRILAIFKYKNVKTEVPYLVFDLQYSISRVLRVIKKYINSFKSHQ